MCRRRAFTLMELLAVVAIVGVLAALLIPALTDARAGGNRARCAAQLHQMGHIFSMYFRDNRDALPKVNMMPSLQPPLNGYPSLVQLLTPHAKGSMGIFQCPADRITQPAISAPPGFETYFAREQSSYYWNEDVSIYASRLIELKNTAKVPLVQEYEPFHGRAGANGAMNRLYADLHVDSNALSKMVVGG